MGTLSLKRIFQGVLVMIPAFTYADVGTELNKFFNQLNGSATANSAEIYDGQRAGYVTGGGVMIRNRVMNTDLYTVSAPRFNAGCGGIDIYNGGFSFINSQELIKTMKNIASSAVTHSFVLGLETLTPQVASTIKSLQAEANKINGMSINSCEVASQLVGAVWPRKALASQHTCRSISTHKGEVNDYVAGMGQCSTQSKYDNEVKDTNTPYKDVLKDEYNIAWEAIKKQKYFANSNDEDWKSLFMTIIGTMIQRNEKNKSIPQYLPSKIYDESFLAKIVHGGEVSVYRCVDQIGSIGKCLVVQEGKMEVKKEKTWLTIIQDHLINMSNKVLNDQPLNEAEIALLSTSNLPLYRIVNVMTAHKKGLCPVDLYQISSIVALELLVQYLDECIQLVREGLYQLKSGQMYANEIDAYEKDLDRVSAEVRQYELRAARSWDYQMRMIDKVDVLHKNLSAKIGIH